MKTSPASRKQDRTIRRTVAVTVLVDIFAESELSVAKAIADLSHEPPSVDRTVAGVHRANYPKGFAVGGEDYTYAIRSRGKGVVKHPPPPRTSTSKTNSR